MECYPPTPHVSDPIKAKMSSLANAAKTNKTHRERRQPEARSKLGLLEKKKDYKLRAKDYNEKKKALQQLRKKALNKNPDEFYFHMINSKMVDGVHTEKGKDVALTPEQISLMQTQDLKYIVSKRTSEKNKIEKLKSGLHLINAEEKPKNTHTFFVDSEKEKREFDVAERLQTLPGLLGRTHNRPKVDDLVKGRMALKLGEGQVEDAAKSASKAYKELSQRLVREKQLGLVQRKMEMKAALRGKVKPERLVKGEEKDAAPVYLWPQERKR